MNLINPIKYLIFGLNKRNLTKITALAAILYFAFTPFYAVAIDYGFGADKPALLALADTRPILGFQAAAFLTQPQNPIFIHGSMLASQSNPSVATKEEPAAKLYSAVSTVKKGVIVTAYSSTPDQTDSSPFITAKGTHVRDGIVATNFLKFGTKVRFPEVYGDKIFVVEDRMALHNSHKVDIWMETREAALQFGVKRLTLEILE